MHTRQQTVHTTINLSRRMMKEAGRLFKNRTKTEIIHEALGRMIQMEKFKQHLKKWGGKGHIKDHG
ncbi:MAG: type II toxin-antitoxin system VapB family antitoxin [Deltaproteobacteria bacterium]|nr:type II toxin-antitoxin system VapB family antitoxin [Deltaproteobacteria bacterium]